jgi:hypothetical protein
MRSLGLCGVLLLAACNGDALDAPFDPTQPLSAPTGLYALTVDTVTDDCDPALASGELPMQGIEVHDGDVSFFFPEDPATFNRDVLGRKDGYHDAHSFTLSCGETWSFEHAVISASMTSLTIDVVDRYADVAACDPGGRDCHAERVLRFDLRKVCPAPMRLTLTADGITDCS